MVQFGLDVEVEFAVASILRYLVLYYGHHRKIVGLDGDLLILNLHYEICSCEARFEEVGQCRGLIFTNDGRYAWNTI